MQPEAELRDLLVALVRAHSVTPYAGPALDVLERTLAPAGFEIARPIFEATGTPPVENLFAAFGRGERQLTFAGHVDVVPPGPDSRWRHPPFSGVIVDGMLFGRGAVDMKGGVAAMIVAVLRFARRRGPDFGGRISFLITGDEEGPAINGTAKLLHWATVRGEKFAAAIVGEPTSARALGDQLKIGRRGSFSATLTVEGRQGHAAYPQDADNPLRGLTQLLFALQAEPLDHGSEHFDPSTLEIVSADVGNPAWNVIPALATARMNSRYNDRWTRESLRTELEKRLAAAADQPTLHARLPIHWTLVEEPATSDVFLTRDEALIGTMSDAIETVTGLRPALSTSGGTSDARFIKDYCPVVEFGPVGATMHAVDECVPLADIAQAARIYEAFLDAFFP